MEGCMWLILCVLQPSLCLVDPAVFILSLQYCLGPLKFTKAIPTTHSKKLGGH